MLNLAGMKKWWNMITKCLPLFLRSASGRWVYGKRDRDFPHLTFCKEHSEFTRGEWAVGCDPWSLGQQLALILPSQDCQSKRKLQPSFGKCGNQCGDATQTGEQLTPLSVFRGEENVKICHRHGTQASSWNRIFLSILRISEGLAFWSVSVVWSAYGRLEFSPVNVYEADQMSPRSQDSTMVFGPI